MVFVSQQAESPLLTQQGKAYRGRHRAKCFSILVLGLTDFSGAGGTPPPVGLSVMLDEVQVTDSVRYNDVRVDWQADDLAGELLTVRATTPEGLLSLNITSALGERRQVELTAPDFGELLRVLDLYENVQGGTFTLTGSMPPAGEQGRSE